MYKGSQVISLATYDCDVCMELHCINIRSMYSFFMLFSFLFHHLLFVYRLGDFSET